MKKIAKPFIWILKYFFRGVFFCLVVPVGLLGVLWAIVTFIFREAKDLVEEQIYKA